MHRLNLHYSKFCGLARQDAFKAWLKTISSELHNYLVQPTNSCKARAERMVFIYNKLYESGKGGEFESFIKSRFPYIIDHGADQTETKKHRVVAKQPNDSSRLVIRQDVNALNKHKVFKMYKPDLLTFPQKRIIINPNADQLKAQVAHFITNKFGVDYIIIDDRAYIEYFDPRYKSSVDKISRESREIYQYRQRNDKGNFSG